MRPNRNATVTQTGNPKGAPRNLRAVNDFPMRRVGIEPTTYSLRKLFDWARSRFFPLETTPDPVESLLEKPRNGNRNRNRTVIRFRPETQEELARAAREEVRQFAFLRGGRWSVLGPEIERKVDRLLHDAEHKQAGAEFARSLRRVEHIEAAKRMERRRDELIAEALKLDPDQTCEAWQDLDLPLPARRAAS